MSDFKIKVTADLDTSQIEAKLMALQNRKITIQANANGLSNMNNSLQQIQNNANSGLCAQVRASSLAGEMPAW